MIASASGSQVPIRVDVSTWALQPHQLRQIWIGSPPRSHFSDVVGNIWDLERSVLDCSFKPTVYLDCPPRPGLSGGKCVLKEKEAVLASPLRETGKPSPSNTYFVEVCWVSGAQAQPRFRDLRHLQDAHSCLALGSASSWHLLSGPAWSMNLTRKHCC